MWRTLSAHPRRNELSVLGLVNPNRPPRSKPSPLSTPMMGSCPLLRANHPPGSGGVDPHPSSPKFLRSRRLLLGGPPAIGSRFKVSRHSPVWTPVMVLRPIFPLRTIRTPSSVYPATHPSPFPDFHPATHPPPPSSLPAISEYPASIVIGSQLTIKLQRSCASPSTRSPVIVFLFSLSLCISTFSPLPCVPLPPIKMLYKFAQMIVS